MRLTRFECDSPGVFIGGIRRSPKIGFSRQTD
jgi:hypothetical protein